MYYLKNSHNSKDLDGIKEALTLLIKSISQKYLNNKKLLKILLPILTSKGVEQIKNHKTNKIVNRLLDKLNRFYKAVKRSN